MGTRGAVGFRIDGTDKVSYNHFDSYPTGLGKDVVEFCRKTSNIDLSPFVRGIRLVREEDAPTPAEIARYRELLNESVGEQSADDWYCLLHGAQGNLDLYLEGLDVMLDAGEFLKDSLFCEWAYIINLDEGVLEVYRGFNKDPKALGRYAALYPAGDDAIPRYYGVVLVESIPLKEAGKIRADQLKALEENEE